MERMNILYQSKPCYDIVFTDSFADLANELSLLSENKRKACIRIPMYIAFTPTRLRKP